MWINKEVFAKAGVAEPNTIQEFINVAPAIQDAGFIPLALGGQPWQESLMLSLIHI